MRRTCSTTRIWRGIQHLIFGDDAEPTLREEIEDAIDEADESRPIAGDLSPAERQMMRNLLINEVNDSTFLTHKMTPMKGHVTAAGGIIGAEPAQGGPTVIVDHTGDNNLMAFRFRFASVPMRAAESDFDAAGHHFGAGSFIIANANRAQIEPALKELSLSGYVADVPGSVKTRIFRRLWAMNMTPSARRCWTRKL